MTVAVPWSAQSKLIFAGRTHRNRVFRAGNKVGKTWGSVYDLCLALAGEHPAQASGAMRMPPIEAWAVGVDYGHGLVADVWPALDGLLRSPGPWSTAIGGAVVQRDPATAGRPFRRDGPNLFGKVLSLRNGSRLTLKSADSADDKFTGTAIDYLLLNEEISETIAEEARRGLVTRGGHLVVAATPVQGLEWIRRLEGAPGTAVIRASMREAVEAGIADREAVEAYLASLPPRQRAVRELGDYAALEGAVYPEFSRATHVAQPRGGELWLGGQPIAPWPLPASWPRTWALDVGYSVPASCGVLATDPRTGRAIVETVLYAREVAPSDWGRYLRALRDSTPALRHVLLICDHDAGARSEIERAGVYTAPAPKGPGSVAAGIAVVQRWLWQRQADGHPRLVVVEDPGMTHPHLGRCDGAGSDQGGLVRELGLYRYRPRSKAAVSADPRDEPVKADDHALDMLRYAVVSLDQPQSAGVIAPAPKQDYEDREPDRRPFASFTR